MAKRNMSRRSFMRNLGIGSAGLLLANAGLPAAMAQTQGHHLTRSSLSNAQLPPEVELLCGDVVAFQLSSNAWEGAFGSVTFQMHQGFYNGESIYYIRTDTSDADFAQDARLVHVPLLNAALTVEGATAPVYTFTNGVDEQYPVLSTAPAEENFTSAWHVHQVTFNGNPTLLDSVEAIMEAEAAGDITVEAQQLVINGPVVKWPGGELQEDTEKTSYLGTGPLIEPVDTDNMLVTFKLHECYPGSRYIITDTSAVPMAPMMSIAPSAPTQALVGVGATDEIWVFGNGIPGSGVMGFQPAIFDNAAGNPIWSPFWEHFTVVWNDESNARLLTSSAEIRELIEAGELTEYKGVPDMDQAMPAFVVNCPVPVKARNTFEQGFCKVWNSVRETIRVGLNWQTQTEFWSLPHDRYYTHHGIRTAGNRILLLGTWLTELS